MNKMLLTTTSTGLAANIGKNGRTLTKLAGVALLVLSFNGYAGTDLSSMIPNDYKAMGTSLYQQIGGADTVSKLSGNLVKSSVKDPRLAGLLGNVDPEKAGDTVASQMCSILGGGCKAPYSSKQVSAAANKLTPEQKTAVSDNFSKSLNAVTSNPALREAVTKSLGPKIGGIIGALL